MPKGHRAGRKFQLRKLAHQLNRPRTIEGTPEEAIERDIAKFDAQVRTREYINGLQSGKPYIRWISGEKVYKIDFEGYFTREYQEKTRELSK